MHGRTNLYCPVCLRSERYLDLGARLVCQVCGHHKERRAPEEVVAARPADTPRFRRPAAAVSCGITIRGADGGQAWNDLVAMFARDDAARRDAR